MSSPSFFATSSTQSYVAGGFANGYGRDGYADVLAGAPGDASGAGRAFLLRGGADGHLVRAGRSRNGRRCRYRR
ncbi:hypothetical protein ACFCWG_38145 [Streptomyces sp. NPDC056390]|uniref:hypothetical protein n=1 Tax=Streptomyces sp. NPDC056390 TaxID=3345806 RepID=UPI0035D641D0